MSEKLKKENKELQEKVDFLTSEIKEIKETLKLVSSKEREIKKTLKEKKLESKESESFVEKILRADGDCKGNNLLKDLTKDYLIELISDSRVGQLIFQKLIGNVKKSKVNFIYDIKDIDGKNKKNSFYRSFVLREFTWREFWENPAFIKLKNNLINFSWRDLDITTASQQHRHFKNFNECFISPNQVDNENSIYKLLKLVTMGLPQNSKFNHYSNEVDVFYMKPIRSGIDDSTNAKLYTRHPNGRRLNLKCDYEDNEHLKITAGIVNLGVWRLCY